MTDDVHQDDDGFLQQEANRVAIEKLDPLVDRLEEALDLQYQDGARDLLMNALIKALMEGVRLGAVDQVAKLQSKGIQVHLHDHMIWPDEPDDEET
jgi:hypothetical protein